MIAAGRRSGGAAARAAQHPRAARPARALGAAAPARRAGTARAFRLLRGDGGGALEFAGPSVAVGTSPDAGVRLAGPGVEPQHARLTQKGKQVYLTALLGDSLLDASATWVDGDEARPQVAYVLSSGSALCFGRQGDPACTFTVQFEEPSGANPLVEMLIQGAAAGASPEVRAALEAGGARD